MVKFSINFAFMFLDYSCALSRDILLHGRLFVSQNWICFYSNIFGWETLVRIHELCELVYDRRN